MYASGSSYQVWNRTATGSTNATGGNSAHTHEITDSTHTHTLTSGSSIITVPPYYMLVYCVKLF